MKEIVFSHLLFVIKTLFFYLRVLVFNLINEEQNT